MTSEVQERHRGVRATVHHASKLVVFLIVVFFTLELCTRIDDAIRYDAPFWGEYSNERLRSSGPDSRNLPNARFEKWQHNSLGFRGPEVLQHKASGAIRVVCLGASESYGLYESPGKEWPSQLRDLLPARYEVINASMAGLTLGSFNKYLKSYVFPLHPDIVILVINPLFYVKTQERGVQSKKTASASPQKVSANVVSLKTKLLSNCRILQKIKQMFKQSIGSNFPDMLKSYQLWSVTKQLGKIERTRLNGREPLDKVPASYLAQFRNELTVTIEYIRSQGIAVMLTSYPTLIGKDTMEQFPEIFLDNRRFCVELSLNGIVDSFERFNLLMAAVSKDKNTMFVDAASLLPKSTEFFADCVHYTDKGSRIFAEGVAKQLLINVNNTAVACYH